MGPIYKRQTRSKSIQRRTEFTDPVARKWWEGGVKAGTLN